MCQWQLEYLLTLFENLYKITGSTVYFSNLWGLLSRIRITNKGLKAFIEKACIKEKIILYWTLSKLLPQKLHFQNLST